MTIEEVIVKIIQSQAIKITMIIEKTGITERMVPSWAKMRKKTIQQSTLDTIGLTASL